MPLLVLRPPQNSGRHTRLGALRHRVARQAAGDLDGLIEGRSGRGLHTSDTYFVN